MIISMYQTPEGTNRFLITERTTKDALEVLGILRKECGMDYDAAVETLVKVMSGTIEYMDTEEVKS